MKKGFKEKYKEAGQSMKESKTKPGVEIKEIEEYVAQNNISAIIKDDETITIDKSDMPLLNDIVSKARYVKIFEPINSRNKISLKIK